MITAKIKNVQKSTAKVGFGLPTKLRLRNHALTKCLHRVLVPYLDYHFVSKNLRKRKADAISNHLAHILATSKTYWWHLCIIYKLSEFTHSTLIAIWNTFLILMHDKCGIKRTCVRLGKRLCKCPISRRFSNSFFGSRMIYLQSTVVPNFAV